MKKLLSLILLATLFVACNDSDNDDNGSEEPQKYTSFTIYTNKPMHPYSKAHCFNDRGESKVYDINHIWSQPSGENFIDLPYDKMYITYKNIELDTYFRIDTVFQLKIGEKNNLSISRTTNEIRLD